MKRIVISFSRTRCKDILRYGILGSWISFQLNRSDTMAYIKKGDLLLLGERKMIAVSDDYTKRMGGGGDYENDWHFIGAVNLLDPTTGIITWAMTSDVKKVS